ncbi:MAG: UDP-3-O-(3-hydroxymyristoyl)glucosamine N-acyltransferase [Gammaproteobacteria bacterium]|nr:UDP-3-O-(3-hydroxymyristoyl)glucosamine N-acyltransferase [Gammaproteobacteria bacterium]
MQKLYTLKEIADFLKSEFRGDANCSITSVAPLDKAQTEQITFLERAKFRPFLKTTKASAVIISEKDASRYDGNIIIVKNPYAAYAKITELFVTPPKGSTAQIGDNCTIPESAILGAGVVIGHNVTIGENSIIGPNCTINDNSTLGKNCRLYANVNIYQDVIIGDRAIIHSGAVIGSDGFGMANEDGRWIKIHQLGSVKIGNDVEIGANTCIDRGALEDTIIGDGVKLDNLIQVAHNVQIGDHTVIAGCTGIAGSAKIGKHCMIGGAANINGHINICDKTIISGTSSVARPIDEADVYTTGFTAIKHRDWMKIVSKIYQLGEISDRIQKLEETVNETT